MKSSFVSNLVRMSLLLAFVKVSQIILLKGQQYPIQESIFRRASFFAVGDVVGVMIGGAAYFLLGMRMSFLISVVLSLSLIVGMMYLIERNDEFNQKRSLSVNLQQLETIQFQCNMEVFVFATQAALSMSVVSHTMGSFIHKKIFPNELRVSAIGFCFLFSLVLE